MESKTPDQMSNSELNSAVATEVMDYEWQESDPLDLDHAGAWLKDKAFACFYFRPAIYINEALQVEAQMEEKGLIQDYINRLWDLTVDPEDDDYEPGCVSELWKIRRATPRQICEAALAAVREAKR